MKHLIFFFNLLLATSSVFASQDIRNLDSFNELKVSESITVKLVKSAKNSVDINVRSGEIEDLITEVSSGVLRIYWKKGTGYNRTAILTLNYTKLASINTMAGAKVVSQDVLTSKDLNLEASSGSKIKLDIECTNLVAEVSSGSTISVKGKTKNQEVDASSGAIYKSEDLITEKTIAEASSGASVVVNVSQTINAEANSGASISYKGNPPNKDLDASEITGGRITNLKQ